MTAQQEYMINGVRIIAPPGTHMNAIAKCTEIIGLEVGRNAYAQKKMTESRTTIVIIPARQKMTDLAHFSSLRDASTFDGRDWSTVRGSGGVRAPDGSFAIGVAEENLISVRGVVSGYTAGYSIGMHELAHAVESKGMTPAQRDKLKSLYESQVRIDRRNTTTHHEAFTDNYASENQHEYFAQATNAFFNRNAGQYREPGSVGRPIPNHNGRDWLRVNDPDMYEFLVDMYETNRDAEGHAA